MTGMTRTTLPLRWLRLPLLLATTGLGAVTIAVGIQALIGIHHLKQQVRFDNAQNKSGSYTVKLTDIEAVSVILTFIGFILCIFSLNFAIHLAKDWLHQLSHKKEFTKEKSIATTLPRSTRTLRWQFYILLFFTIWLLTVLIPTTIFVRTRSAMVTISGTVPLNSIPDWSYWDIGYLRCLAAAPWFSFIFAAPATAVTFWAYRISHSYAESVSDQS